MEQALLQSLHLDPADHVARLALADWLEENDRAAQAELLRLVVRQMQGVGTRAELKRVNALLREGVLPMAPELTNSIGMRFALVPGGTFPVWSAPGRFEDDAPIPTTRTDLTLTRAYYLGVFPVTQAEYERVTGENPSYFTGEAEQCQGLDVSRFPVDSVTWRQAEAFCRALSALPREKQAGRVYRLPTEAEWERACRAGAAHDQPFYTGSSLNKLANFDGKYGGKRGRYLARTSAVGSYPPNAFGLYDMLGNLWEWCADRHGENPFQRQRVDPAGPGRGSERVCRGGCWDGIATACWTAYRIDQGPDDTDNRHGFRIALNWPAKGESA